MGEAMTGVNGAIIRWARLNYNMTEDAAAKAIGTSADEYVKWENGESFPTYAKLKLISDVFRKPSAIFFFPTPPSLPDMRGDLRTLSNAIVDTFSKNIIVQFEKAKAYQLNLYELYGKRETLLSKIDASSLSIKGLCDYFRAAFMFPLDAQKQRKSDKVVFEIFREKFYEQGIYVFKDSFKDNSVSGLCIDDSCYPVIIINNSMSFARQNFTLFHELYHLLLKTNGVEIIRDNYYGFLSSEQTRAEKACDSFANEFLIPTDDFKIELTKRPLSEAQIVSLAALYSVSKEAIMYKLYQLNKISSEDYDALKEVFYGDAIRNGSRPKDTSGGNHYFTKLSYLGTQYTGEVFRQYFSGKIDNYKASEMLCSKVDHLSKLESTFFRGVS